MATCTAAHTCCRAFLYLSLVLSSNEATFVCCYYPTYGENHFSSYFFFSTPLSAFILSYSFFCYCVNGKWVFASRIKVYSVSIYFPHAAAACLTRKMFCVSFCISLLSKEWTLGKNNNKNNSKATLVMTSNRKIRETNRADDFWCCRVSFFFVCATAEVSHPLVVLKTFFYWHSTSLDDNFTTTQNFRGWDKKSFWMSSG